MQLIPLLRHDRQRRARIISDSAQAPNVADTLSIFCPSAEGLAGYPLEVLCVLPIHDANGCLLSALGRPLAQPHQLFAGVFAVDPFRRRTDILTAIRAAGIVAVVNFPSIGSFDGAVRAEFETLGFGLSTEVEFIRDAVCDGFSAAAVIDSVEAAAAMISAGASVLIAIASLTASMPAVSKMAAAALVEFVTLAGEE